jgi:hypothetical protein
MRRRVPWEIPFVSIDVCNPIAQLLRLLSGK